VRHLILVKHSLPEIVPAVPASRWLLSEEGRRRCTALADQLAAWRPAVIVTSREPKAAATAELVAARLQRPWEIAAGLHEHERDGVGFLEKREFEAAIAAFFGNPNILILGDETATQAHQRFTAAVETVLQRHERGNVVVVAHGTVISLYVAGRTGQSPWSLWQRLGLPSFVVVTVPDGRVVSVVEGV
jgi:broad specificity phosphatase PhoE